MKPTELTKQIRELHAHGRARAEIAEMLKITRERVKVALRPRKPSGLPRGRSRTGHPDDIVDVHLRMPRDVAMLLRQRAAKLGCSQGDLVWRLLRAPVPHVW